MYFSIRILIILCINIKSLPATDTKNVLVIIIDDLRPLADDNITLPYMDKLCKLGVNFKNAYAQQSLCAPSRNSLLTGRRPDSLRLYDFYNYWRDAVGNFTTLPQYFKANGYETYSVGKIFHPGQSSNFTDDYPYSWSHLPYHPPTEVYKDAAVCNDPATKQLQSNLVCPVVTKEQPGNTLPDIESLDHAVNILKSRHNNTQPFFLAVGFYKPHIPLKFPRRFLKLISKNKVKLPQHPDIPNKMPSVAWHPWTDIRKRDDIKSLNITFPYGLMPKKWTLKIRRSYYAAAMYIDTLIGGLMSYVDTRKTIVVITSDHGWSLGENGLWAKYSNFDVALRVPLIILAPNLKSRVINEPVELVDIFPTLVHLAELPLNIPSCKESKDKILCFDGKSLLPVMQGFEAENQVAISQYPRPSLYPQKNSDKPRLKDIKIMGYSIRTARYRYTKWVAFNITSFTINWYKSYGIELYDHIIDPDESNNLYLVHEYKHIMDYLSNVLRSKIDLEY